MGNLTFRPQFTITNSIASGLTKIERAQGFLEAAALSEDWIREMGERALILEAHHTTHIEGTRLTLEEAEHLWVGERLPDVNPDDVRELLNYRGAFDFVSEYLETGGPITEALIRTIHEKLVEGVRGDEASPGEYRDTQNYVVNSQTHEIIYAPPPANDVPAMMAEFVDWLNAEKDVHPVLISGIAQFQLVHIHPFRDGNGRTSRLLSTLVLYKKGYDFKRLFTISEYYDRDRARFYRAIQQVRERGMDITVWLEYYVEGLATQMKEIADKGNQVIRQDILSKKYGLSARQDLALRFIIEKGKLVISDYEALRPDVSRRTLQRDLKDMVEKGLLVSEGATTNFVYRLNRDKRNS